MENIFWQMRPQLTYTFHVQRDGVSQSHIGHDCHVRGPRSWDGNIVVFDMYMLLVVDSEPRSLLICGLQSIVVCVITAVSSLG